MAIQLDHPLIDIHTHLMPERLFQAHYPEMPRWEFPPPKAGRVAQWRPG